MFVSWIIYTCDYYIYKLFSLKILPGIFFQSKIESTTSFPWFLLPTHMFEKPYNLSSDNQRNRVSGKNNYLEHF